MKEKGKVHASATDLDNSCHHSWQYPTAVSVFMAESYVWLFQRGTEEASADMHYRKGLETDTSVNVWRLLTALASPKLGAALRVIRGYVKSQHFRSDTERSTYLSKVVALSGARNDGAVRPLSQTVCARVDNEVQPRRDTDDRKFRW